jgi:putative NIF3 family GTP cyclohydrolase 1 type 2
MTAEEAALLVEQHFGTAWKSSGTDGFKAGDPKTEVTGIATAWTPTLEVLKQAVRAKQNLIITVQGPFWAGEGTGGGGGGLRQSSRVPTTGPARGPGGRGGQPPGLTVEGTAAYAAKKKFIDDNKLVLWRFGENWQSLPGQYRLRALTAALGWQKYQDAKATESVSPVGGAVFAVPSTALRNLAGDLKRNQGWHSLRVLGDPAATISRVAVRPGYLRVPDAMRLVRGTKVDAVICGESCEWEAFPYFEDWVTAGWGKAFIQLGFAASEDPGSKAMADWLKSLFPETRVSAIACGEPFKVGKA